MRLDLHLKHGPTKLAWSIDDQVTISELMSQIESELSIPKTGQKLILNGQALTSLDHGSTLQQAGVRNLSKIMVLGRRFDPEGDQMYQNILQAEKKVQITAEKLQQVADEVRDIERGFLSPEHHQKAWPSLLKRCRNGSEEFMRLLETLDTFRFEEHQQMAKSKRKSLVDIINKKLDANDELQRKVERLQAIAHG
ncbi:BAG family molecular chaperone regulator 1-like [Tigriopus californicus]|uniref:BAG family molecular chaperone regulator 1-like n=1 Tax=Tigriopus californicus TaxID=6832 RepID=UPI0027DA28F3|nr:BAG family molecular chaperone regulator 1-like [Tigriopus californicus]|eukprot:TCALIF_10750-PA protein Name:"Similar to Bag1 BAG family molecular chaperone regulator 1 (Rattus norvegicus)" AED:0.27 eAED:0.27 QI:588/1/1/1/1/1/2/616/194